MKQVKYPTKPIQEQKVKKDPILMDFGNKMVAAMVSTLNDPRSHDKSN